MKMLAMSFEKAAQLKAALDNASFAIKECVGADNDQSATLDELSTWLEGAMNPQGTPIVFDPREPRKKIGPKEVTQGRGPCGG